MRYYPMSMGFVVLFFNDKSMLFMSEDLCDSIDILASQPTRMQWLQAENAINVLAIKHWKKWFPYKPETRWGR